MKSQKLNYEDEKILIINDIICFIFVLLALYSLFGAYQQYLNGDFGIGILLLISFLIILISCSFAYVGLANIINSRYNRKLAKTIINNGIKVTGKIISIETTKSANYKNSMFKKASFFRRKIIRLDDDLRTIEHYDYAKVEYKYKDKTYNIDTPYLEFCPKYLKEKTVDVYIYNNLCYVDNFKIDTKKNEKARSKYKNKNVLVIVSFFIMFLILGMMIYLCIVDALDFKYIPIAFIILMLIYVFIFIKYYLKKL